MRTNKTGLLAATVIFSVLFFAIQASALENRSYDAAKSKIYTMQLEYNKGDISFKSIVVNNGFAPDRKIQPEAGYKAEVISFKDEILYSFKFEIPLIILTEPPINPNEKSQGLIILDNVNFTLTIPYFENGKAINIYDANGTKKLSVDISRFAVGCGNKICESGESYVSCPADCPSGYNDGLCDAVKDGRCDSDCPSGSDTDCSETVLPPQETQQPKNAYEENKYYVFAGIVLLLIISAFVVYKKMQKKR